MMSDFYSPGLQLEFYRRFSGDVYSWPSKHIYYIYLVAHGLHGALYPQIVSSEKTV